MRDLEGLRPWLDDRAGQNLFSGVVLVRQGTKALIEHAAGLAHRGHRVPLTIDTRFQVASVGKMVTAVAALKMVEEGSLSLDRPLTGYLPPQYRPASLDDRHTLHHLLSHTSGLPNYFDDEDETWESWTAAMDRIPGYKAAGPSDLLPLFADLPAVNDPGAEYVYCDSNFVLVGLLLEWVGGKPFAEVATELVLEPARMTRSGFFDLDREPEDHATGYMGDGPVETWRANTFSLTYRGMPDGGMTSTAHDLDHFLTTLRSGELVHPDTFSMMTTPHGIDPESWDAYGYGMELVVDKDQVTIIGHSGSDPGVTANISHYMARDTTVVVICNQDRGAWAVVQRVAEDLDLDDPRE